MANALDCNLCFGDVAPDAIYNNPCGCGATFHKSCAYKLYLSQQAMKQDLHCCYCQKSLPLKNRLIHLLPYLPTALGMFAKIVATGGVLASIFPNQNNWKDRISSGAMGMFVSSWIAAAVVSVKMSERCGFNHKSIFTGFVVLYSAIASQFLNKLVVETEYSNKNLTPVLFGAFFANNLALYYKIRDN